MSGTRLEGKIALVSGGARGMGATHSRAIIAEGGHVVIADILDEEGQALAGELGERAAYFHLDVTSQDDWEAAVQFAVNRFGGLNVLVNNAGIASFGAIGQYTPQQWEQILAINLTGPFLGISAARDALVASAPSSIINVSSTNGLRGSVAAHGYTASKFGLRGLTKSVALELGPFSVRANSIHPGVIATPMTEGLVLPPGSTGVFDRPGTPEEVSALVVYLASDESSYSTGAEFLVDGGQMAGTGPATETS